MTTLKFETSCGDFTVELNEAWAPKGVERFVDLVNQNFFDNARFFRVVNKPRPFVIQFGINGDPAVAAKWRSNTIKDDKPQTTNAAGTLTFATSGPNSRTTQLFINLADNSFLDNQGFAPIGKVTSGMDTVQKINGEYGESPDQGRIQQQGNAYLEKSFPRLDYIKSVTILD